MQHSVDVKNVKKCLDLNEDMTWDVYDSYMDAFDVSDYIHTYENS